MLSDAQQFDRPATESPDLVVEGGATAGSDILRTLTVPGDKSISHRGLMAALLPGAPEVVTLRNANLGQAVRALIPAMRALGLGVDVTPEEITVRQAHSPVPQPVRPHATVASWPRGVPYLETGGSSAAARLLVGLLAGAGTPAVVDGDEVLRHRPMDWLVEPLVQLGAEIDYLGEPGRLPVLVRRPVDRPGSVELKVGSAQARSGVLMAAVAAHLPVELHHRVRSRDHSERMLAAFGAKLIEAPDRTVYDGGDYTVPGLLDIPADPSLAAYPVAAHLLHDDNGELHIPDVCLNPTRLGFFDVLRRAGADITYADHYVTAGGEPSGTIVVRGGLADVGAIRVDEPAVLHSLIDEVPLLAAVATRLPGVSWIGCAEELRFKETDRLATTQRMLAAFGAQVEARDDGLLVTGGIPLASCTAPSFEDHRIAMAAATLATCLPGRTTVSGGACHRTSFPDFVDVQRAVGVRVFEGSKK
ncbi:3-phosphoshikimate 1-carboxyvinyltransferase [Actinobacteria bacterium OK074]|nr:3-phosphoshikimate 1-carboxyvinyltransferase [Actinobacteria bacterium OK074]